MKASNLVIFNAYIAKVEDTKQFGETTIKEFSANINFKNKNGDKRTLWKNCKMFNKTIEFFGNIQKGDFVKITGEMDVECWQAQDGTQRSKEIIIVDTIEFVSYRKQDDTTHPGNQQMQQMMPQQQPVYQQPTPQQNEQATQGDLPF